MRLPSRFQQLTVEVAALGPTRTDRWRRITIVVLGVLALLSYATLVSVDLWRSHERDLEYALRIQQNLARVLERHALATVDKIDTVLLATQLRLQPMAHEAMDTTTLNSTLGRYLTLVDESQSLRVANREGRFVYDASGTLSNATITDRDYFQRNRDQADGELVISAPLFARITNNWVITLSRRITNAQGEFAGLVQAAVRADHFQAFYTSLQLGPAHSVALMDSQVRLVARHPPAPDMLGRVMGNDVFNPLLRRDSQEGSFTTVSEVDGVERLFVWRQVGNHPLYVVVGHATDDVLANWTQQFWRSLGTLLVLAAVMTGWMLVWLRTHRQAMTLATRMTDAYVSTVRRTRALLDSLPDPAWLTDRDSRMIAVNEAYVQACGQPPSKIIGQTAHDIWPAPSVSSIHGQDAMALDQLQQQRQEATQTLASGDLRHVECISTPVLDENGMLMGVAGVARDITQFRQDQARIHHLAEHDILTDLPNRALLGKRVSEALASAREHHTSVALLFLDLDHFKNVNDTLGHEVGDQLLQQVALRLVQQLSPQDTVSRQGGDEFTVLLRSRDAHSVGAMAQRLVDAIAPPFMVEVHELLVTVSIGISLYPQDGVDMSTLLKNADTAMYQAKAVGGGGFQFFAPQMNAHIIERAALETNLRRAIESQEFRLHYQPQVDGSTGQLVGLEALIRWHHPQMGDVPPGRFIPIAEESNLINTIGQWVLREACRQTRAWMDQGLPPMVVAVNLSAMQFQQRDLVQQVTDALSDARLPAQWLELEITEGVLMRDSPRIIETLAELKAMGVQLSVDDFGTGYSSLSYLKRIPFDKIKIDQSFVRELPGNEDDVAITSAIIGIARGLRKEVIAEGVERADQREFLLQHGCRWMQGYHFSRPQPPETITTLLSQGLLLPRELEVSSR